MNVNAPARSRRAHSFPLAVGIGAGLVATAAALGILLGIGRRAGTAWRLVNAAAHTVIGARADGVWNFHGSVTPVGGVVVLAVCLVAGVLVALLASSGRTLHVVVASAVTTVAGYLVHLHVAASTPGGLTALMSVGELRALYLAIGIALVLGIRFAFLSSDALSEL